MVWSGDGSFGERVASLCCECYTRRVGKKGKPQAGKAWTLLAAVVMTTDRDGQGESNPTVPYRRSGSRGGGGGRRTPLPPILGTP